MATDPDPSSNQHRTNQHRTNQHRVEPRWSIAPAIAVATVGDPEGTRTVTAIVALLVVIGIGLVMLAIWLFRVTRPDPELLAPLEIMSERRWRRGDPVWQRRRLDEVRPPGAQPLEPSPSPPELDEAFDAGPAASGFDDLQDTDLDEVVVSVPGDPLLGGRTPHPPPAGRPLAPPPATARPRVHLVDAGDPVRSGATVPDGMRPLDPAVLAAAMADLDAELARERERPTADDGAGERS